MDVEYKVNAPVSAAQFIDLLERSTLGERRPIDDLPCMEGMINNSNLVVSAWHEERLVGISRSMTDFHYACYLSDLAVCAQYQKMGIGRKLLALTQDAIKEKCKLILIAAPAANDYYEPLGFAHSPRCWVLGPESKIKI